VFLLKSVEADRVEKLVRLAALEPVGITAKQIVTAQVTAQSLVAETSMQQTVALELPTHAHHALRVRRTTTDASTTLG
jgi:hypothetical protein